MRVLADIPAFTDPGSKEDPRADVEPGNGTELRDAVRLKQIRVPQEHATPKESSPLTAPRVYSRGSSTLMAVKLVNVSVMSGPTLSWLAEIWPASFTCTATEVPVPSRGSRRFQREDTLAMRGRTVDVAIKPTEASISIAGAAPMRIPRITGA